MNKLFFLTLLPLIFFSGCNDKSIAKLYDEEFSNPPCLRLVVFPPDEFIQNNMNTLYKFDESCEYKIVVEKKAGIICNSTHNVEEKTTSNFPSGYLKMDVTKGSKNLYSYYIDLKNSPSASDLKTAFKRIKKDIKLP